MIVIREPSSCFGCTACMNICREGAIVMRSDEEGFTYPHVNSSLCVECGLCESVCPLSRVDEMKHSLSVQSVYALRNNDSKELARSASGGAFGPMARAVLQRGGVVYGVAYTSDMKAEHVAVEDISTLYRLHDSKYVQSSLSDTFSQVARQLKDGRFVLFSGTPCQVAGLRAFLRHQYTNLITCDILCHSVASPKVFADYIHFVEQHTRHHIINLSLRDKKCGWRRGGATRIDFSDGTSIRDSYWASIWAVAYPLHLITRPSCHSCPFCSGERVGDLSLGDFWGVEKALPFFDSAGGVSLLLVNTKLGQTLWKQIQSSFHYEATTLALATQPVLESASRPNPRRDEFWQDYSRGGFETVVRKYWGYDWISRLKRLIIKLLRVSHVHLLFGNLLFDYLAILPVPIVEL